jgi:hypothetical protein
MVFFFNYITFNKDFTLFIQIEKGILREKRPVLNDFCYLCWKDLVSSSIYETQLSKSCILINKFLEKSIAVLSFDEFWIEKNKT